MYELIVERMNCGHCAGRVTDVVKAVDPEGKLILDLERKRIRIDSTCEPAAFIRSLAEAGYPARPVEETPIPS